MSLKDRDGGEMYSYCEDDRSFARLESMQSQSTHCESHSQATKLDFSGSENETYEEIINWLVMAAKTEFGHETHADICLLSQFTEACPTSPISSEWSGEEPIWQSGSRLSDSDAAWKCYVSKAPVEDYRRVDGTWAYPELSLHSNMSSVIHLPIMACTRCIGVLQLASPYFNTFTKDFSQVATVAALRLIKVELELQTKSQGELLKSVFPAHIIDHLLTGRQDAEDPLDLDFTWQRAATTNTECEDGCSPSAMMRRLNTDRMRRHESICQGVPDLPSGVMEQLQRLPYAELHPNVALLFADIKGFTPLCARSPDPEVMVVVDRLFNSFDNIIEKYQPMAYKVETAGDGYLVACGLLPGAQMEPPLVKALWCLRIASEMHLSAKQEGREIRIGLHIGSVMSGIVGKLKPQYGLFGTAMNTASRMESTGRAGEIHVSSSFHSVCDHVVDFKPCGTRHIKGIGEMSTFAVDPEKVLNMRPFVDPFKRILQGALGRLSKH